MNDSDTEIILEYINSNTHPDFSKCPPKIHVLGGIGSGKSSLLHAIHSQLRMHNAGLKINHNRAHSRAQLLTQRCKGIRRANATSEPESLSLYAFADNQFITMDIIAGGGHRNAKRLFVDQYADNISELPSTALLCVDLTFLKYILEHRGIRESFVDRCHYDDNYPFLPDWMPTFKADIDEVVLKSFVEQLDMCLMYQENDVPVLTVLTHYASLNSSSRTYKLLREGTLFERVGEILDEREKRILGDTLFNYLETEKHLAEEHLKEYMEESSVRERLEVLFEEGALYIDSRVSSRPGIEELAYQTALAATDRKYSDLKLVSFSHHVPDTERVVKYNIIKDKLPSTPHS